jgi:hypothetical protein
MSIQLDFPRVLERWPSFLGGAVLTLELALFATVFGALLGTLAAVGRGALGALIARVLIDDHRRIFDTLVARDPDRADATLRKHFEIGNEYRKRAITGEIGSITTSPENLQTKRRANSRKII